MIPQKQNTVLKHILFEFILLNLCIASVLFIRDFWGLNTNNNPELNKSFLYLSVMFNVVWGGIISINRDQDYYTGTVVFGKIKNTVLNAFLLIGITSSIAIVLKLEYFNRTTLFLPTFLFTICHLFLFSLLFEYFKRRQGFQDGPSALIVGVGEKYNEFVSFCERMQQANYKVLGYVSNRERKQLKAMDWKGAIEDLPDILTNSNVNELFLTLSDLDKSDVKQLIKTADYHGVRVNLVPETSLYVGNNFKSYNMNGVPCFKYRQSPLDQVNNYIFKKAFDILFASVILVLLAPVFLLIAILIYLDSGGPIVYTPMRKGEGGQLFKCYKFRTMSVCDDPLNGTKSTVKDDPRITRVGKYLRKYDLDELPQFFNVLKGDMSVVGPRPHRVNLKADFRRIVNDYMVRHYVKPGITGWAQVNGWRGPTVTNQQKKSRIQHDLWYIENWRFLLDIKIIFLTVFSKKTRKNAF